MLETNTCKVVVHGYDCGSWGALIEERRGLHRGPECIAAPWKMFAVPEARWFEFLVAAWDQFAFNFEDQGTVLEKAHNGALAFAGLKVPKGPLEVFGGHRELTAAACQERRGAYAHALSALLKGTCPTPFPRPAWEALYKYWHEVAADEDRRYFERDPERFEARRRDGELTYVQKVDSAWHVPFVFVDRAYCHGSHAVRVVQLAPNRIVRPACGLCSYCRDCNVAADTLVVTGRFGYTRATESESDVYRRTIDGHDRTK